MVGGAGGPARIRQAPGNDDHPLCGVRRVPREGEPPRDDGGQGTPTPVDTIVRPSSSLSSSSTPVLSGVNSTAEESRPAGEAVDSMRAYTAAAIEAALEIDSTRWENRLRPGRGRRITTPARAARSRARSAPARHTRQMGDFDGDDEQSTPVPHQTTHEHQDQGVSTRPAPTGPAPIPLSTTAVAFLAPRTVAALPIRPHQPLLPSERLWPNSRLCRSAFDASISAWTKSPYLVHNKRTEKSVAAIMELNRPNHAHLCRPGIFRPPDMMVQRSPSSQWSPNSTRMLRPVRS